MRCSDRCCVTCNTRCSNSSNACVRCISHVGCCDFSSGHVRYNSVVRCSNRFFSSGHVRCISAVTCSDQTLSTGCVCCDQTSRSRLVGCVGHVRCNSVVTCSEQTSSSGRVCSDQTSGSGCVRCKCCNMQ